MKFLIGFGAGVVGVFLLALGVLRQTSHAIVGTGLTAGTTQTQADGLALTADINEVSTVASTDNTVVLPTATIGRRVTIINNGANTLRIYPGSGDDLGAGVDTFLVGGLAAGANITFEAYDATTWEVAHHSSVAQHAESHSLASHSTEAHSELTGVGTADHHGNDAHAGLILSGLVSARPAAATLDRFFWATDENILYHDTGSAWEKAAVADHVDLDGIGTDDHHAKYTDAEAIAAVEGEATLVLAGDVTIDGAKTLKVDVIDEKDSAAGVTIDSVLLKDGAIADGAVPATHSGSAHHLASDAGPPNGTASGELGGSYPSPTVDATHSGSAHHAQAHTAASHSDQAATGAELESLTDGSEVTLHSHAGGGPSQATQAAIEAQTNENTYAPPDLIKHSPGVAKIWAYISANGLTVNKSYNLASHTDDGVGIGTFTIDIDFSSSSYVVNLSGQSTSTVKTQSSTVHTIGAGSFKYIMLDGNATTTDAVVDVGRFMAAFGDQ